MARPIQRLLLLQPPIEDFYATAPRQEPLGLESLAGAVRRHFPELECRLLDLRGGGKRRRPLPPELAALAPHYLAGDKSPFRLFGEYGRFGWEGSRIAAAIAAFRPDLIAISALFHAYAEQALEVARLGKQAAPQAAVVLGGGFPTLTPEAALDAPEVDFIVRGEGERPLVELIRWLGGSGGEPGAVPGLGWRREDGRPVIAPPHREDDFAALPAPWRPPGVWPYRLGQEKLAALTFSRGCPRQCLFCSSREMFGGRHRPRRPADLLAEMAVLAERRGVSAFNFEDDNLTAAPEAAAALFSGIIERFGERRLALYAMNGLSYFHLSPELLTLFYRAGLRKLDLSLAVTRGASGASAYLQRELDGDRFWELLRTAAALHLPTTSYFIAGLPGQTAGELAATVLDLYRQPTLIAPSFFYLIPGTRLAEHLAATQPLRPSGAAAFLARSSALNCLGGELSPADLASLFAVCRVFNFLKEAAPPAAAEIDLVQSGLSEKDEIRLAQRPSPGLLGRLVLRRYLQRGELCALLPLPAGASAFAARFVPRPLSGPLGHDVLWALEGELRRAALLAPASGLW